MDRSRKDSDTASAVDAVWEWFSAALAWSLFTLPEQGIRILSTDCGYVQFLRTRTILQCEVSSNHMLGVQRISADGEALLAADGWELPGADSNWVLEIRSPGEYTIYEHTAASIVSALRDVLELSLPFELETKGWITDWWDTTDPEYRYAIRGVGLLSGFWPSDRSASELLRFVEAGWAELAESKRPGTYWRIAEGGVRYPVDR
ncbi:TY-Chap domain-containing protein [Nocardia sp. NBC_01327]|uniref:TY-Chap domain-containing protein n=1 Tax=Nocardia sp. NBC_01327 TaxID=2903593 RepID=UPI002E1623DA|nr:hypothetical protein OG326_18715 [Nocardia sp. NBC_01327]